MYIFREDPPDADEEKRTGFWMERGVGEEVRGDEVLWWKNNTSTLLIGKLSEIQFLTSSHILTTN